MTFEEGLEKLKERHEALAQSLELHEAQSNERGSRQDARIDRLVESIQDLLSLARNHENRLLRLDGQP